MPQVPSGRRDAVDVARVLALLVVVLGHLALAVVDRHDGAVRGSNLLTLHPEWAWLAAAAPMPVFFAAAGWANAGASVTSVAARIRALVGTAATVVVGWSVAVVLARVVAGDPGVVADGARIATQPVWFLAAYVPFVAAGGRLARLAARSPAAVLGGCLAALALVDLARFALDAPQWVGWVCFPLAWGLPWLAGGWWRDRAGAGFAEQRTGLVLAVVAAAAAVALVQLAGYSPSLIDVVAGARSNTTPPTLYTGVVALAQVGVLLVAAPALDAAGHRWRRLWDRAGEAAVGIYLWHLTALALCAAVVALGLPVPARLTAGWWAVRPLWWAAVLAVALGLVAVTAAVREALRRSHPPRPGPGAGRVLAGLVLATAGAAVVGLRGPRTVGAALTCSALLGAGWLALRGGRFTGRQAGAAQGEPGGASPHTAGT